MTDSEFIAYNFHELYEALAPEFGYKTRKESAVAWKDVPEQNKKLMIATVQELFNHGLITKGANFELGIKRSNILRSIAFDNNSTNPEAKSEV